MGRIAVSVYTVGKDDHAARNGREYLEECERTVALVKEILSDMDERKFHLNIRPWRKGEPRLVGHSNAYPPILLINDQVVSQGVVPDRNYLSKRMTEALESKA